MEDHRPGYRHSPAVGRRHWGQDSWLQAQPCLADGVEESWDPFQGLTSETGHPREQRGEGMGMGAKIKEVMKGRSPFRRKTKMSANVFMLVGWGRNMERSVSPPEEQTKLFVLLKGPNPQWFLWVCFFFQSVIFGSSPGDLILSTSGPKDNWVTSFLYIRISHSVWEIEDFWNIWEMPVFSPRWTKEWLINHTDRTHLALKIITRNIPLSVGTWWIKADLHSTLLLSPVRKLRYVFKVTLTLFCNWK